MQSLVTSRASLSCGWWHSWGPLCTDGAELSLCHLPALQLGNLPYLVQWWAVTLWSFTLFPSSTQQFEFQCCPFQLFPSLGDFKGQVETQSSEFLKHWGEQDPSAQHVLYNGFLIWSQAVSGLWLASCPGSGEAVWNCTLHTHTATPVSHGYGQDVFSPHKHSCGSSPNQPGWFAFEELGASLQCCQPHGSCPMPFPSGPQPRVLKDRDLETKKQGIKGILHLETKRSYWKSVYVSFWSAFEEMAAEWWALFHLAGLQSWDG